MHCATTGRRPVYFRALLAASAVAASLLAPVAARAQAGPPGAVEQFQLWTQVAVAKSFAPGIKGIMEIWPRFRSRPTFALDRIFLRPWVAFRVDESNSVWLGAAAILNYPAGRSEQTETRFLQQHVGAYPAGDWTISTRLRVEERILPNAPSLSVRLRARAGIEVPLDPDKIWSFILNDEIFFNLNDAGVNNLRGGLSENRAIAGFKTKVAPGVGIEFGYQHNWVNRDTTFDDVKHCLLFNIGFDIDEMAAAPRQAEATDDKKVGAEAQPEVVVAQKLPELPEPTVDIFASEPQEPTVAQLAAEPQSQTRLSAQIAAAQPAQRATQADSPQKQEKPFKPLAMDFLDGDAAESYDP
ncbi:DUF2490 domain-containing protein [Gloeobacter violaceus]|nr:DUF2490 domain-containing protein [Gloeobacter violaceus]